MFPSKHFLSYLLSFVSESEKPLKMRGSKRSEWKILTGVAVLFHERRTCARTHTISHAERRTADREKLLLSFLLLPSRTRQASKDDTAFVAQVLLPRSLPGGGGPDVQRVGDVEQSLHAQTAQHRKVGKRPRGL